MLGEDANVLKIIQLLLNYTPGTLIALNPFEFTNEKSANSALFLRGNGDRIFAHFCAGKL